MSKFESFKKKLKSIKNLEVIIAVVLCLIILIVFVTGIFGGNKTSNANSKPKDDYDDFVEYQMQIESRITELILAIDGVFETSVAVSYSGGYETVYAYETISVTENGVTTTKKELVYVDGKPLVVQELAPTVQGVAVVVKAKKINSAVLKMQVTQFIVTLLDIDSNKIQVITYCS